MVEDASRIEMETESREQTIAIGRRVGRLVKAGEVIALSGEFGAGKTQFVRGVAEGMGLDGRGVSSPTYVMMQEYEPGVEAGRDVEAGGGGEVVGEAENVLVHIDAYRITSLDELESVGLDAGELRDRGVLAIEWAERLPGDSFCDPLRVAIAHVDDERRRIVLSGGDAWKGRLDYLNAACPICEKPVVDDAFEPMCSKRCKQVDLGKWLSGGEAGGYRVSRPLDEADFEEV